MKLHYLFIGFISIWLSQDLYTQEGLPVYSDYLTDNYYLIHPSFAGAGLCSQIRVTGRRNWVGEEDAPGLYTAAFNGRIGDQSGIGAQFYSDRNGYTSHTGGYLTYAHHLMFSRSEADLNMLSLGISAGVINHRLDESNFNGNGDPLVGNNRLSNTEFNMDIGASYHLYNFYSHFTLKNILPNSGINNDTEFGNDLKSLLLSVGYIIEKRNQDVSFEPSIMYIRRLQLKDSFLDFNLKLYTDMENGKIWGGISYRTGLELSEYEIDNSFTEQRHSMITPFAGVNFKNFMVAYTYSHQLNSLVFSNGGFHQITLGYDFSCRKKRSACYCPAVN